MRAVIVAVVVLRGLASSPAAADDPPRPITKRLLRKLVRGDHPLAEFIDPAAGVVAIEWPGDDWDRVQPARVRHLCGEEIGAGMPMLMFAVQRSLGGSVADEVLTCSNRPAPSCTLGERDVFRVDFRHDDDRGLVIEAIVHLSGYRTLSVAERDERVRFAAARVAAARHATCPVTVATRPTMVTKRLLRELGWGLRPMADVIDLRRGVVRASWPNSGSEDDRTPPARHLCGADVDLEAFRRGLLGVASNEEGGYLACKNVPRHECVGSELIDEYSNHDHVVFVDDPDRGVVLESWIDLDENLTSPENQGTQRRWASRLVADARARPCIP